jgi:hypothetical protein
MLLRSTVILRSSSRICEIDQAGRQRDRLSSGDYMYPTKPLLELFPWRLMMLTMLAIAFATYVG